MATVMSARNKRSRDEADMLIKLTAAGPMQAESFILRAFSSVARGLPADATEFDVSGLLLDGQPYGKETVQCWLNCGRSTVYGPAELDAEDISMLSTVHQLHQVLSFAHAVGSPDGLLTAACRHVSSLKFALSLPEQTLQVPLVGCSQFESETRFLHYDLIRVKDYEVESEEQLQQVQREFAVQAGKLLHIAHVLRLAPLIGALHDFLFENGMCDSAPSTTNGILYGVLDLVFTEAVLDAALGSSTISKEAYLNSILTRPCSFLPNTPHFKRLFKPISAKPSDVHLGMVSFKAELLRDYLGAKAGNEVTVDLDILGERPTVQFYGEEQQVCMVYPVQLLLGTQISTPQELDAVMNSRLPASLG